MIGYKIGNHVTILSSNNKFLNVKSQWTQQKYKV